MKTVTKYQVNRICAAYLSECLHEWIGQSSGMFCSICGYPVAYYQTPPSNPDFFPPSPDFWRLWDKVKTDGRIRFIIDYECWVHHKFSVASIDTIITTLPMLIANHFLSIWNTPEGEKWFWEECPQTNCLSPECKENPECGGTGKFLTPLGKAVKEAVDETVKRT